MVLKMLVASWGGFLFHSAATLESPEPCVSQTFCVWRRQLHGREAGMLVLSRKKGERIIARLGQGGPTLEIDVVDVRANGQIRLGFSERNTDGKAFQIFRDEVRDQWEDEE